MIEIIPESPTHFGAVKDVTVAAFSKSEFGHNGEAELVESIRSQCDSVISLVATEYSTVVGHILFSPAVIHSGSSVINGMGLAPMSVLPSHQGSGIGSMLVKEGLRRVGETVSMFTIVAGHPNYYPKFGFRPAREFSVTHGFEGMPQDILFVHWARKTTALTGGNGRAFYHGAFGPQHGE